MRLFLSRREEVAVDAEQWPMEVLPVLRCFARTFHIQASVIPFPATLNSIGHQRHAPFQR